MGLSRNEDILQSIVDGTQYTDPPKSRVEDLLLQVKEVIEAGGGGTSDYPQLTNKPQINGITLIGDKSASDLSLASLDANGKVPAAQLPSYVDDVINGYLYEGHFYEDSAHTTEITGESGKIYVDLESNKTYRWSGLAFVEISESLALGETASTAYAGDKGKANADAITAIKDGQTIDSFGDVETALGDKVDKVDGKGLSTNDYTDADKAIVGGVTAALAGKQASLTAGKYIDIDSNNEISVDRVIPNESASYEIKTINTADPNIDTRIIKTVNGDVVWSQDYNYQTVRDNPVTIDGVFVLSYASNSWKYKLLVASDEHTAGFEQTWGWSQWIDYTEDFSTIDHSGEKLIIKSELDTAIGAIKDGQSIDSFADVETALAGKADLTDLAPAFSTATAYTVGQYVSYDGNIYKCTSAHSAGAWEAGDFTLVTVGSELESKQNATDNSLQTTDKTVVGAINEHEGDIGSLMSGLTNLDVDIDAPNRKNLLPMTLANIKAVNSGGTWTDNVLVYKGVTYTVNLDASGNVTSITAEGTADASGSTCAICSQSTPYIRQELNGKKLTYSGCPAGGSEQTYNLYGWKVTTGESGIRDTGSGVTFNAINMNSSFNFAVIIGGSYAIPEGGITFYPMLRPATITDPTFAPYIPSVESRIEAVESGLTNLIKATVVENKVNVDSNGYINLLTLGFDSTYKFVSVIVKGLSSSVDYYAQVWKSYSYGWIVTIYQNGTFTKLTDPSIDLNISVIGFK